MLAELLRIITPEALALAIKNNPKLVQLTLQKFEAYSSFGDAMSVQQQVCISNNMDKLSTFFKTNTGKELISMIADEFQKFVDI